MHILDFDYMLLLRLAAAAVLGGLVGLERGMKSHEAGLRTHIVLCLGSASVMVVGECIMREYGSGDMMRMGAQVISGVGFLGAGSIIVDGVRVRGITTAAGLWTTACVGLVVGSGYYVIAATVVALILIAMWGLHSFSNRLEAKAQRVSIRIDLDSRQAIQGVLGTLAQEGVEVYAIRMEGEGEDVSIVLDVKMQGGEVTRRVMSLLAVFEGVREFSTVQTGA